MQDTNKEPIVRGAGRFTGTWADRLGGVFDCGVDFRNQSVLDVGCNIGIISYEVSKRNPRLIHGVDIDQDSVDIASRIFRGEDIPYQFTQLDLRNEQKVADAIKGEYDIVLYLAVEQHLIRQSPDAARYVSKLLLEKCNKTMIYRSPPNLSGPFKELANDCGFEKTYEQKRESINSALRFDRKEQA